VDLLRDDHRLAFDQQRSIAVPRFDVVLRREDVRPALGLSAGDQTTAAGVALDRRLVARDAEQLGDVVARLGSGRSLDQQALAHDAAKLHHADARLAGQESELRPAGVHDAVGHDVGAQVAVLPFGLLHDAGVAEDLGNRQPVRVGMRLERDGDDLDLVRGEHGVREVGGDVRGEGSKSTAENAESAEDGA
jgi:hypothetical protein